MLTPLPEVSAPGGRPADRTEWGWRRAMTMHMEWDTAAECGATIYTREAALQEFGSDLDDVIAAPYVLALGGNGDGALGIAGTREDLIKLGVDIKEAASKLPDVRS